MVVLINGSVYSYPRKKPIGALDEFCDTIRAARAAAAPNIVPLEARPTVDIDGSSNSTLIVLQREVGAILGADRAEIDKQLQAQAPAGTVVLPMARLRSPNNIASVDATTCLILSMSNPITKDVAIAHMDNENQTKDAMVQMLRLINLNFSQSAASAAAEKAGAGAAAPAAGSVLPTVHVKMLGATKWHEYSPQTLSVLLKTLIDEPKVCFDFGDGTDIAVWSLNLDVAANKCIKRGLMVDNNGGPGVPVECCDGNRTYPAGKLRALRSFAQDDKLSSVTLFRGEESIAATPPPPAAAAAADAAPAAAAPAPAAASQPQSKAAAISAEKQLEIVKSTVPLYKIVVRPFEWRQFVQDAAQRPLDFFLKLSGTPTMEPSDFAETVKAAVIFANMFKPEDVFKEKRPHVFAPTDNGNWVKI